MCRNGNRHTVAGMAAARRGRASAKQRIMAWSMGAPIWRLSGRERCSDRPGLIGSGHHQAVCGGHRQLSRSLRPGQGMSAADLSAVSSPEALLGAKAKQRSSRISGRPGLPAQLYLYPALTHYSFNHLSWQVLAIITNRSSLLLGNVMSRDHRSGSVAEEAIPNSSPGSGITGIVIAYVADATMCTRTVNPSAAASGSAPATPCCAWPSRPASSEPPAVSVPVVSA